VREEPFIVHGCTIVAIRVRAGVTRSFDPLGATGAGDCRRARRAFPGTDAGQFPCAGATARTNANGSPLRCLL
jgi:hypothetical protein